jgi:hypothetical protein
MRKIEKNDKSVQSDFGLDQMLWPNGKVVQINNNFFCFFNIFL